MKKIKNNKKNQLIKITAMMAALSSSAHAFSPIVRPYQAMRNAAMGNVRYTTGFYEENFFSNPARAAANPENLFQFPKITLETGLDTISSLSEIASASGNSGAGAFAGVIGKPISARVQIMALAFHDAEWFSEKWAMSIGLPLHFQTVAQVSNANVLTPTTVFQVGPALTIARRLLPEDRLSIGLTTHFETRITSGEAVNLINFLRGDTISDLKGGSGASLDFDLGATFRPHWGLGGFKYETAFTINNILGGNYNNLGGKLKSMSNTPIPSLRSVNFGLAARKDALWVFENFVMALEFTDIGNNTNGSIFRTIHLGSEARWKRIDIRAGINQGYLCGGLGFDLKIFKLNLTTYGEEMGLNTGSMEDRRVGMDLGFEI
jgi:hypothetical protein